VGCAVDLDRRTMSFSLNGSFAAPMGVAFQDFAFMRGLYPAATFSNDQSLVFNFGGPAGGERQLVHRG
jgi:hypothetical protein